nr:unnamed protein product [Callosobruchus chinensis]
MFVHPSGLTYSKASLNVCMAQPPVGTSSRQVKQVLPVARNLKVAVSLSCAEIAFLITVSFLSIKGATNDRSSRYVYFIHT